jgi:hypothetical protein
MTPKEKAEELLNKINAVTDEWGNYPMCFDTSKQCALIAVDEILNFDIKAKNESQFVIEKRIEDYWQEVKQEIEKL